METTEETLVQEDPHIIIIGAKEEVKVQVEEEEEQEETIAEFMPIIEMNQQNDEPKDNMNEQNFEALHVEIMDGSQLEKVKENEEQKEKDTQENIDVVALVDESLIQSIETMDLNSQENEVDSPLIQQDQFDNQSEMANQESITESEIPMTTSEQDPDARFDELDGFQSSTFETTTPGNLLESSQSIILDDTNSFSAALNQTTMLEDSVIEPLNQSTTSQLSPEQAYSAKVQSFLKARNLKGEFSAIERTTSRGRPQSSGRLYENTRSFELKCELRKAKEEMIQSFQKKRSQSVGVRSRPTTPQAPKFHTTSRSTRDANNPKLSSEEVAYRIVLEQKKIQEKIMKKHQHMFENLKNKRNSTVPITARSTKELTIPTTPYSHVDNRLGKREVVIIPEEKKEIKIKKQLGPTHIEPFQFSTEARASLRGGGEHSTPISEGITAGEILAKFHRDPRSHDVPKSYTNTVTRPHSPKLHTSSRSDAACGRPKVPSRLEQEEAELQAAKAYVFKAKPVDKRIFESTGDLGVPKIQPKEVTQPHEFHLASSQRAAHRSSLQQQQQQQQQQGQGQGTQSKEEKSLFKARPMPSFEEDPRKVIRRGETKVTEAHSPKLHGGVRASSAPARRQKTNHLLVEKLKHENLIKLKVENKQPLKLTEPEEFDFQTSKRGLAARAALEARLAREREEEKRKSEIHARPFPEKIFKESFILAPSTKPLTEIEEFHLATDERYLKSLSSSSSHSNSNSMSGSNSHSHDLTSNENSENIFHARPLPKSTYQPSFSIQPSHREPLIPKDINLLTSQRAIERKSFDETINQQHEMEMKQKELQDQQKEAEIQKEIKKLRSKSITEGGYQFKATPILQEDPFPTRHVETNKLTEPISPKLLTSLRVRNHTERIQM